MVSMPTSGSPARYLRQAAKKVSRTWSREGSNTGLFPVFAQVADQAFGAAGLARDADVAAVQDQPVMRVLKELGRREFHQFLLYLQRVLARGEAGAVGDAKDVRVHRHGRLAERGVEHHVRRLAPDARQLLQRLAVLRHGAAVPLEEHLRQRDHVPGLVAIQADAL